MLSRFEQFSSSISCIYRYVQKIERVEMARYGLKGPHAQCLLLLSRYPDGMTVGQLCAVSDKDKAAVSRTLSELEREGLVEREAPNGNLYRAMLRLTKRGEQASRQVEERASFAAEKAGKDLTNQQRRVFYEALGLIAARLRIMSEQGLEELKQDD